MIKNLLLFGGLVVSLQFPAISLATPNVYSFDTYAIGTLINSKFKTETPEKAEFCAQIVNDETRRLEYLLSAYIEDSDVSRLGREPGKWVPVDKDTADILISSKKLADETNGTFDPTVGAIVKMWSVDQDNHRIPKEKEIADSLKFVNYRLIEVRNEGNTWEARLGENQKITLGAIGKGFIADKVMDKLRENGCDNSLISFGGNVIANGTNAENKPWRIGLQQPDQERGRFFAVVPVSDTSVVTSGDYEKFFIQDGVKYHHILNPTTGKPVPATLSSVTIVNNSSTKADGLCTALFVMGWDGAIEYLKNHPSLEAVLVSEDLKKIAFTENLRGILDVVDPRFHVEVIAEKKD